MSTATLTKVNGYHVYYHTFYVASENNDWSWYLGHWNGDMGKDVREYAAGCVEYSVPYISDDPVTGTITLPCVFGNNSGPATICATLSTVKPEKATQDESFRFGPTSGIISDTIWITCKATTKAFDLTFTLTGGADISGKMVYLYLYRPFEGYGAAGTHSSIISKSFSDGSIDYIQPHTLTIDEGVGSHITVNRTSSHNGSTGYLNDGDSIFDGDTLLISFAPEENYKLLTHTVNGAEFESGNTHTVSADVSVCSTAQMQVSTVLATDADIGSTSVITVSSNSDLHTHTLMYEFQGSSGVIAEGVSSPTIEWTIPSTFYMLIPNEINGMCVISCETFSDGVSLGVSTCSIVITASESKCRPSLIVSVADSNDTTIGLTGDNSILIRHLSSALCNVTAVARGGATIKTVTINGEPLEDGVRTKIFDNVEISSFRFAATDSRGYTIKRTVRLTMIRYVKLTINPVISRPASTSGIATLSFNGRFFPGSIGSIVNTLTIRYRYRAASDPSYSQWINLGSTHYTISESSSSYSSIGDIPIVDTEGNQAVFDYQLPYEFQIQALDGTEDLVLSTVTATVPMGKGTPVFDWGENDFNINVDLLLRNVNILDIIYPVGAVYMHSDSVLPTTLTAGGMTWQSLPESVNDMFCWKRIS